jgi:glutathione S-transferase
MSGRNRVYVYYFKGRGRAEIIRWTLAACDVGFSNIDLEGPEDINRLREDGRLAFDQVPLVKIDGIDMVQTASIVQYIASTRKPDLVGGNDKIKAYKINMVCESARDFAGGVMPYAFQVKSGADWEGTQKTVLSKYLPLLERLISNNRESDVFTVGSTMTLGDISFAQSLWIYKECLGDGILEEFPKSKALATAVWEHPDIKEYLSSEWHWPLSDGAYVDNVNLVLQR